MRPFVTPSRWSFLAVLIGASPALAQQPPPPAFPQDAAWAPLRCRNRWMEDRYADAADAPNERDLVGNQERPTAFRAADDQFLYLRLRLDEDPVPAGVARTATWGVLFDTNEDLRSYEVLVRVNGLQNRVELYRNQSILRRDAPDEEPDAPPEATYPLAQNARSVAAVGSTFGDNADFFLDAAVPWTALRELGLGPESSARIWTATSAASEALDGDLACYGGDGGKLSEAEPERNVLDPARDADRDGYADDYERQSGTNPNDASSVPAAPLGAPSLEGGGGCASVPGSWATPWPLWLSLLWLRRTRRRA